MKLMRLRFIFLLLFCLFGRPLKAFAQEVDLNITDHYLAGVKVLKVFKTLYTPMVWALAENNKIYRINSSTGQVDDLSSQFSIYSNYHFIDLVTADDQEIFVATDGNAVIWLKNGVLSLINSQKGLLGNVNSIGLMMSDYTVYGEVGTFKNSNYINIVTNTGWARMYLDNDQFQYTPTIVPYTIFDLGYCSYFRADYQLVSELLRFKEVLFYNYDSANESMIFLKDYGEPITAYSDFGHTSFGSPTDEDISIYWGTKKGLYQNWYASGFDQQFVEHYLDGIQVNKVSGLLNMMSFGPQYFKSNILVGTQAGLYFSNTGESIGYRPSGHVFKHLDALGNVPIYDIDLTTIDVHPRDYSCESRVWLASQDGVYGLTPDYKPYDQHETIDALSFQDHYDNTKLQLCPGENAKAVVNTGQSNLIEWFNGSTAIAGEHSPNLTITAAGDYHAVISDPCTGTSKTTNVLTVTVSANPVFDFDYPDVMTGCPGVPVSLNATGYGNAVYEYRWYKDGGLTGDVGAVLDINESGSFKVYVKACSGNWVTSKTVAVKFMDGAPPEIIADKTSYCSGETATLSLKSAPDNGSTVSWWKDSEKIAGSDNQNQIKVTDPGYYTAVLSNTTGTCTVPSLPKEIVFVSTPVFTFNYADELGICNGFSTTLTAQGSATYQYRWYKNGMLTGDTKAALQIEQAGKYKVEVSACTNSWVPSKEVQVDVITLPLPVIKADKDTYCQGTTAKLSVNIPTDPSYTIHWMFAGNEVAGSLNQIAINTTQPGTYTVVVDGPGAVCRQISNGLPLVFNPLPTIGIEPLSTTGFCTGQYATLKANYSGGTIKWSDGETTDQIMVSASGTYQATVTSQSGCAASASVDVPFNPDPALTMNDVTICEFLTGPVTLTAPSIFKKYTWNGVVGDNKFLATKPGTVTLIVEDANGCQAIRLIQVAENCPEIHIPNTFTPNGDGTNDTWVIAGVQDNPITHVWVYNRLGNIVYQSTGYYTPWDGTYAGKKLPTGTYYYVIENQIGSQKLSGSVTIIY